MLNRTTKVITAAAAFALVGAGQAQAEMMIEMLFNEPGTTATNTAPGTYITPQSGTETAFADGQFRSGTWGNVGEDRHAADGSGVTGLAGDHAFDPDTAAVLNLAPGNGQNGWVSQDITISGWFKTNGGTAWGGGDDGVQQSILYALSGGNNQLRIYESDSVENSPVVHIVSSDWTDSEAPEFTSTVDVETPLWTNTEEWVFFAMSYEGSATSDTDRIKFYSGTQSQGVSQVASGDAIAHTLYIHDSFIWGNDTDLGKNIDGLVDNLRMHDEALSVASLEGLRTGDVIPEPASLALLGVGAMTMLLRRRSHA